ncbi:MAG: MFS transporter [Nitrococcus sp.]|nr:MFS transporter [Nitrococcus sp.]
MTTRYAISGFVALFISLGLVLIGSGLLGILLGVRMTIEGFPTQIIGLIAACYSLGFIVATRVCGPLIGEVGHIRSFAAFCAIAASSALAHPLLISPWLWGLERIFYGFSMAGLFMVVESWLNSCTPQPFRGRILGVYGTVTYVGLGSGQFLLLTGSPAGFELFSLAAILSALSLVPITLMRTISPEIIKLRALRLRDLYRVSPLGVVGAGATGVINGSFLGMAPVFAKDMGFAHSSIAALMGCTIIGGFLLQWPLGHLSDLYNRRLVIAGVAFAASLFSIGIVYAGDQSEYLVIALALVWGGLAFSLYSICAALANDLLEPTDVLGASAALLLMYGIGLIVGPVLAAQMMAAMGPLGLFWTIAGAALWLSAYAAVCSWVGEPIQPEAAVHYRSVPRNTPYATTLDPRSEPVQMELDFGDPPHESRGQLP